MCSGTGVPRRALLRSGRVQRQIHRHHLLPLRQLLLLARFQQLAVLLLIKEPETGSFRQQSQFLFVIHRLPWDKFLGKHIHSSKESQLEE